MKLGLRLRFFVALLFCVSIAIAQEKAANPLKLLFLGDNGHHQPARRFEQLKPVMAQRGIELTYTDKVDDLNPATLNQYAGLILYANIDEISPSQAKALLEYVAGGKGFIPLHCASYCFRNNDEVVALMGAQFQRHGTGVFRTTPSEAATSHPVTRGYRGFESWDETYVHTKHNEKDRIVLEYREDTEGREPWTWVRMHGKGRVFYTAWGHDQRTWSHLGFQNLVERGIRWAVGADLSTVPAFADIPEMTPQRKDVKPFEYVEAKMPFYPAGERWGTMGEPITKMQKPLPPEESIKHFVTPVGFEVQLFASEPDLQGKPLAMNWDERGRLWLCESVDYPNELQPPGQGRDRIRICEDTDNDGRADKFTVFAEKLSIPAAINFYRGGAIVQSGTETLYLKDTNGDDQADLRKVLVTGWAMNDTHGGVSNFQYGHDNWYYAMQGYNNSRPVLTDGKEATPFRQGFFRFKVKGEGEATAVTELEFLRSTNNNTWGLGLSEEGLIFGSTANGNPSEYMPIPNRYYEQVRGWSSSVLNGIAESNRFDPVTKQVRQVDHHGGFTAAAGHALYTARAWPQEYWNRTAFVCEPTGHLVATFVITPDGSGFRSKNSWNILASDDEWSAPIMAEVGPDGQLWVIDWYNIIVQHNPTPAGYKTGKGNAYEIELRDKNHARIYRVVHKQSPRYEPVKLDANKPEMLLASLKHDNMFWRLRAQRLLVESKRMQTIKADLEELVKRDSLASIHALWTLDHAEYFLQTDPNTLPLSLRSWMKNSRHVGVKRNYLLAQQLWWQEDVLPTGEVRETGDWKTRPPISWVQDDDPQVRLAALLAMCNPSVHHDEAAIAIVEALCDERNLADHWIPDALTAAAAAHSQWFLVRMATRPNAPPAHAKLLEITTRVADHYSRNEYINAIPELIRALPKASSPVQDAILAGMARGATRDVDHKFDAATEESIAELFSQLSARSRGNLITWANRWGVKSLEKHAAEIAASLLTQVQDSQLSDRARIAAATQLIEFRKEDTATATDLLSLINVRTPPELAQGLIEAAGRSASADVGKRLVDDLDALTPAARSTALRVLLGRADWVQTLIAGLESGKAQLSDLTLDQKQALTAHPDRRIAGRARQLLSRGGGLPDADRQKVIDELSPLVIKKADATKGKQVFIQQCAKCHRHGEVPGSGDPSILASAATGSTATAEKSDGQSGTKPAAAAEGIAHSTGPDLTGMAVHPKSELIIHILDPSRSVEGNFRVYTVTTAEGRVYTGLLSSESRTAIELVDAEAKRHALQREDIEELIPSRKSLMPEGFEKQVPPEAIADLLEFLTQRGKYLPIALEKAANVITTKGMFYNETAAAERLIFANWSPKTVEGVPFVLIDPRGDRVRNAVMLYGPQGSLPPKMPKSVSLACNSPVKAIHLLSGVSGWGFPYSEKGSVTMIVRLHYADGSTEDHQLLNGVHFADYIRRVDVPESKFAFALRGQQIRMISVRPKRNSDIATIELVKGADDTAPVVMAVTIEN